MRHVCSIGGADGVWRKVGRIFVPSGTGWRFSHAQNPLPVVLSDGRVRVHFATRDDQNRSRGGWCEFDPARPDHIDAVSEAPTLDLGALGAFDDAGVMPSSLVDWQSVTYLYYTGWSRTVDVPFAFHIGLARSDDGGLTFNRVSRAPVLGRTAHDPFITGAPFVCLEEGRFRMWYVSGLRWERQAGGPPRHHYTIKHAESLDGEVWRTSDHIALPLDVGEYAVARPVVWRALGRYHMWFSYRGDGRTYRVGSASSDDGLTWGRGADPTGLGTSEAGWDAGMLCYAHPFETGDRRYALFNGGEYGRHGFGLAVWSAR